MLWFLLAIKMHAKWIINMYVATLSMHVKFVGGLVEA